MGALALPRRLTATKANRFVCRKLRVFFNAEELFDVDHYDLDKQIIIRRGGPVQEGRVEVCWKLDVKLYGKDA